MGSERNVIRRLRKVVPEMECKEGCHDCCGPIMFSRWEYGRIPDREFSTVVCPYLSLVSGCTVYEERPLLCRLFGSTTEVKEMTCPHGCKPEKPLSVRQMSEIMDDYIELFPFVEDEGGQLVHGLSVRKGKYVFGGEDDGAG